MSINIHPTTGKTVHLWTPIAEVEPQALSQLENVARLPWVFHHVAAMADVHFGIGATVGSVIAMKDALAPAAVGVDIGCVDRDTEFLSPSGWRRIGEYNGDDEVGQYDARTGVVTFVHPEQYVRRPSSGFWHFRTKYGIDQMLSSDHRALVWRIRGRDRRREQCVIPAGELAEEHNELVLGAKVEFQTTFLPRIYTEMPLSISELRVQIAVMADGKFDKRNDSRYVRLKFVKDRKKIRLRSLLDAAGIAFEERVEHDDRYEDGQMVAFYFDAPMREKSYDKFWSASATQLQIIADECLHWDGSLKDRAFFTRDEKSADFMQYAFAATGKRSVMRQDIDNDGDIDYRVFAHDDPMTGLSGSPKTPAERVDSPDGFEYCFTLPTGFWVMRRAGKIAVTGNCGMGAIRTSLRASDLPDNLEALRSAIEAAIPVGFNSHERPAFGTRSIEAIKRDGEKLFSEFGELTGKVQDLSGRAKSQVGTLGGGNHFIEICLDTDQHVWLMLHSGSRNIGKVLAEYHIGVARGLAHNQELPDRDLAVFLAGTQEMASYKNDLMWAQRYAFFNRRVMFELLQGVVADYFHVDGAEDVCFEDPILCHHNYVAEETHFGEEVLVTRKGAIFAGLDTLGIIPGSMGTRSYIVRGLGNPESFCSASHGAGRRMSRGAAKRTFTMVDFAEQTAGVCCRKDAGVLDEIPGAYKDIDRVMENQADLVEIVATLKGVLCVKG